MTKKRFIAGAICPQCQAQDRLVVEESDGAPIRRCVSCGFTDHQPAATSVTLPTRFVRRGLANSEAKPIKLIDD
ncbi:MAG: YheV family putative metal-binding protein [Gammaproteobacteria bacterium]|nr:YheV family putative metal-binding protein [Gammaproteobacteria bacterium]